MSSMTPLDIQSSHVECWLETYNWQKFQAEGHSITVRMPRRDNCPACQENRIHNEQERQFHAQDQVFCLNLFTPGTNPDDWKNTGIQCIRVQAATQEEAVRLMQAAIVDTVFAFGRQEHSKQFAQSQLDDLNNKQNWLHIFMTDNMAVPEGSTPLGEAVKILRQHFKAKSGKDALPSDNNQYLPPNWRRD